MELQEELDVALRSRFTLICIASCEEERIAEELRSLCERTGRTLYLWDHAEYFQGLAGADKSVPTAKDPLTALEAIEKMDGAVVVLLRDFHQCWESSPRVIRKLRSLAQKLKYTRKTIVVSGAALKVPVDLRDEAVIVELPPPGPKELERVLKKLLATPGTRVNLSPEDLDRLIRAGLGLSSNQAQRVFAKALVSNGVLEAEDIRTVASEKKQLVRQSEALEFYTATETILDVGGLGVLKDWLRQREKAFTPQARKYGLPPPRGILLIGIPGTGKSLTAKMAATLWRLPLIRLDAGALFGSLVGESEARTRRALELAETAAPCVLWIDEIEKALATGDNDGGTSLRVLGTFLSWMQEKTQPVFVIATANNIGRLPPELLRRGRLDEIFFLDLPTQDERQQIFEVHIRKRRRNPKSFDIARLVAASHGYVGSEIEQAIIDAMYTAFNDSQRPEREFTTEDVVQALRRMVPLSRSQREFIEQLRSWLREGRAQSASFREPAEAQDAFVNIPLELPGAEGKN